jgi:hypothetical protein
MPDDPKKRGKADRSRVNLEQAHERRYWCKKMRCSQRELALIDYLETTYTDRDVLTPDGLEWWLDLGNKLLAEAKHSSTKKSKRGRAK